MPSPLTLDSETAGVLTGIEQLFDTWRMPDYANAAHPPRVLARSGTEPYPVQARLVAMDGTETWTSATVVRVVPTGHVMVRIAGSPDPTLRTQTDYVWLREQDVIPTDVGDARHTR